MDEALQMWKTACRQLEAMGSELIATAADEDHGQERLEHLIDQMVVMFAWEVLHADPNRPAFHRHNDLVSQWGGPNADNVYHHARIDPTLRYRISGRMHSCQEFILAMRAGFMHNEVWGTKKTLTASGLGVGANDDFNFTIGPGCDHEIPDGVIMCSFREYYYDWTNDEPATLTIECLDEERVDVVPLAARIGRAVSQIHDSVTYWERYMLENRVERTDNEFQSSIAVAKGLQNARYSFCFWDLEPDKAIIVECDVPGAKHWGMQLYKMDTFELVDPVDSSLNQAQMVVDDDGRFRLVLSRTDIGAPNWLDNKGRRTGLMTLRWFWPTGETAPEPTTRVVSADQAFALLPAQTRRITPTERAAVVRSRRTHLGWRFRS